MLRFELPGWNLGLEVRIWTLRPGFGPHNWDMSFKEDGRTEEKKKKEEVKISHMCENRSSIPLGLLPKKWQLDLSVLP